jgi:hypothetical protein
VTEPSTLCALPPKSLKGHLPCLLLRSEGRPAPVALSLRLSRRWVCEPSGLVVAMTRQAAPRSVRPNRGVLRRVGVPSIAGGAQFDEVDLAMAGHAQREVVRDVLAVETLRCGVEHQSRRRSVGAECSLKPLGLSATLASPRDDLPGSVMDTGVRVSRAKFDHTAERTNAPHGQPIGLHVGGGRPC